MHFFIVKVRYVSMLVSPSPPLMQTAPPAPASMLPCAALTKRHLSALVEMYCSLLKLGTCTLHRGHCELRI
jgi:hypothetical protein